MKKALIAALLLFSINTIVQAQENQPIQTTTVSTNIDIGDFVNALTAEELLIILSIGKLKRLTDTPRISQMLHTLETQVNTALNTIFEDQLLSNYHLSPDEREHIILAFQQKLIFELYMLVYKRAQELIAAENNHNKEIILQFQLTPEELQNYLEQHNN